MTNSLTAFSPTYWSRMLGHKRYKSEVFRALASFKEEAVLRDGQIVDRPYRSDVEDEAYTKGTALNAQDLTGTSDQLTVNRIQGILMYVDNVDKIQNKYSAANEWIKEARIRLSVTIDAYFLYEVFSAADTIDDGDIGGTAGNGITAASSNIDDIFAAINQKMDANNLPLEGRFLVMSPQFKKVLWKRIASKASELGDRTGETGNIGEYDGLKLYLSNNLTGSARITPTGNPSNNDTITIAGITFTFVSSIGATAGNVLIGSALADTLDNLVTLITTPGTTTATGVAFTGSNLRKVQKWVAVDGTTYVEVRVRGGSYLTVSSSNSATLVWTAAQQIQNLFAGIKGCADVVVQKNPDVDMDKTTSAGKWGMNILVMDLFGMKTFNQGTNEMFKVQLRSDAF